MNGVFGVYNGNESQIKHIENFGKQGSAVLYKNESLGCAVQLFCPAGRPQKAKVFNNVAGRYDVILFGDVFIGDEEITEPLSLIGGGSPDMNGEFVIIVVDNKEKKMLLSIDQICASPVYYAEHAGSFVFSSFMPQVHRLSGESKCIYGKAVHDFLAYGYCMGEDTFFKDIKRVLPGHTVHFDGRAKAQKYKIEKEDYTENISQLQDEVMDSLIKAIGRRIYSQDAVIAMSGGLDSRFMFGILNKYFSESVHLHPVMWSQNNSDEAFIAEQVCKTAGKKLEVIELEAKDFITGYDECCDIHGGNDLLFQSFLPGIGRKLKEKAGMVFTGFAMDLSLGGTFTDAGIIAEKVLTPEFVEGKRGVIKAKIFSNEDFAQGLLADMDFTGYKNSLYDELGRNTFDEMGRRFHDFAFSNRVYNLVINRDVVPRQDIEYAYPSIDLEFINATNKIHPQDKASHGFYRDLFIKEFPELSAINYFNTGLPLTAPREYWQESKRIEAEREALYNRIFADGNTDIVYKHYYSNYNQWLISDDVWRRDISAIINSDASLIYKLLNKEYVRKLYNGHLGGQNNRSKIIAVCTLEKIMRYYGIENIE